MPQALHEFARRVLMAASISIEVVEVLESRWSTAVENGAIQLGGAAPSFVEWLANEGALDERGQQTLEYLSRGYVTIEVAAASVQASRIAALVGATSTDETPHESPTTTAQADEAIADTSAAMAHAQPVPSVAATAKPARADAAAPTADSAGAVSLTPDDILQKGKRVRGLVIFDEIEFGAHGRAGFAYDQKQKRFVVVKTLEESAQAWIDARADDARDPTRRLPGLRLVTRSPLPMAVYDWIDGISLESFARRFAPLGVGSALALTLEVANAVASLGRQERSHGSICARNVRLDADSKVHLLDWGLAGAPRGSLAPELDEGQATSAGDIFAIGSMLFRLLCGFEGRRPKTEEESFEQLGKMREAGHSHELVCLVESCIAFDPGKRFQTVAELVVALGRLLHAGVLEVPIQDGDVAASKSVENEIEQGLNWLEDSDGGFPLSQEDIKRKRERAKSQRARPDDVSTEATASALDEMRSELVQTFRKRKRGSRSATDGVVDANQSEVVPSDEPFMEIEDDGR